MINDPFIVFLNTQGIFLLIIFVVVLEWFVLKKREIALHAIFSVITAFVIAIVLKELFNVPRPFSMPGVESRAGLTQLSSFPSIHSALAFSLATTVALHQKYFGVFFLVIAALISIGRVAASVHYPMDIAFGVLIGVLVGVFFDRVHFSAKEGK